MEFHLAPLKNISCWAFRAMFHGVTDSYTEMISLKSLIMNKQKAWENVDTFSIPGQRQWLQVLTNNLRDIAKLPRCLSQYYFNNPDRTNIYGVNINAGSPDPEIIAAGEGAALVKRTKRLKELIEAFLEKPDSHSFHVSCKMRLGLNAREMNFNKVRDFLEEIRIIDDPRLSPTIVHFKHVQQTSQEAPHWEFLESILDVGVPIIINGGIGMPKHVDQIRERLKFQYQKSWNKLISGIMIGRTAIKDPNCFELFNPLQNKKQNE